MHRNAANQLTTFFIFRTAIECVRSFYQTPSFHNETKGWIYIKIEFNPQKNISLLQHSPRFFVHSSIMPPWRHLNTLYYSGQSKLIANDMIFSCGFIAYGQLKALWSLVQILLALFNWDNTVSWWAKVKWKKQGILISLSACQFHCVCYCPTWTVIVSRIVSVIFTVKIAVIATLRSRWAGACNSHTKPMSRHFYRLIYF